MFKLHREGKQIILIATIGAALSVYALGYLPAHWRWLGLSLTLIIIIFLALILWFFRDPQRSITIEEGTILAPADGKVVVIENVYEDEYLKQEAIQVSIFMSPINVHLNRNPVSGIIRYFKYHPGEYLVAWHPKSSTHNERTTTVYETANGEKILMRQIAGKLARRIRWYIKENQKVEQGGEMGFIRFGSRVDLFLPLSAKVLVKLGDRPVGGETLIARLAG